MKQERIVGGLSCGEVLRDLSAYVDGELDACRRQAIETHLRGCELCERFGGVFAATVQSLRTRLHRDDDLADDVSQRLADALRKRR